MNTLTRQIYSGYSLADCRDIFLLSDEDLNKKIIHLGSGFSSFCAEMKALGKGAIACDPIYQNSEDQLNSLYQSHSHWLSEHLQIDSEHYHWQKYKNLNQYLSNYKSIAQNFLADITQDTDHERYLSTEYAELQISPNQYQLMLCSNYFLQNQASSVKAQLHVIKSLCDVATELRIYPLLDRFTQSTDDLGPLILALQAENYLIEVKKSNYEFLKEADALLCISRKQCDISA